LLPGFLFSALGPAALGPAANVVRLPAADVPHPLRSRDPALMFQPIMRLDWEIYSVAVGDRHFSLSCRRPYPKWAAFKERIIKTIETLIPVINDREVERYSLKYTNIIAGESIEEQLSNINMKLWVANHEITDEHINLQVHINSGELINIVTIITSAHATMLDGEQLSGVIVDVDSVKINKIPFSALVKNFEESLEGTRLKNKSIFFDALTSEALQKLGPSYD